MDCLTDQKGLLNAADYLSRHPNLPTHIAPEEEQVAEEDVHYLVNDTIPKSLTIEEIKEAMSRDPVLSKVRQSMQSGKWDDKDPEIKPYHLSMC